MERLQSTFTSLFLYFHLKLKIYPANDLRDRHIPASTFFPSNARKDFAPTGFDLCCGSGPSWSRTFLADSGSLPLRSSSGFLPKQDVFEFLKVLKSNSCKEKQLKCVVDQKGISFDSGSGFCDNSSSGL